MKRLLTALLLLSLTSLFFACGSKETPKNSTQEKKISKAHVMIGFSGGPGCYFQYEKGKNDSLFISRGNAIYRTTLDPVRSDSLFLLASGALNNVHLSSDDPKINDGLVVFLNVSAGNTELTGRWQVAQTNELPAGVQQCIRFINRSLPPEQQLK